jgi:hypothetical protein
MVESGVQRLPRRTVGLERRFRPAFAAMKDAFREIGRRRPRGRRQCCNGGSVRSSAKRTAVWGRARRVHADVATSDRPPRPDCEVGARAERSVEIRRLRLSAQLTGVQQRARNRSHQVSPSRLASRENGSQPAVGGPA